MADQTTHPGFDECDCLSDGSTGGGHEASLERAGRPVGGSVDVGMAVEHLRVQLRAVSRAPVIYRAFGAATETSVGFYTGATFDSGEA